MLRTMKLLTIEFFRYLKFRTLDCGLNITIFVCICHKCCHVSIKYLWQNLLTYAILFNCRIEIIVIVNFEK